MGNRKLRLCVVYQVFLFKVRESAAIPFPPNFRASFRSAAKFGCNRCEASQCSPAMRDSGFATTVGPASRLPLNAALNSKLACSRQLWSYTLTASSHASSCTSSSKPKFACTFPIFGQHTNLIALLANIKQSADELWVCDEENVFILGFLAFLGMYMCIIQWRGRFRLLLHFHSTFVLQSEHDHNYIKNSIVTYFFREVLDMVLIDQNCLQSLL